MTLKKKFQRHLLISGSGVRVPGSPPKKKTISVFFLLPETLQRLSNLCPCSARRTPNKSRSQTFSLGHSASACLPACASYCASPAVHQTRPYRSFFIAGDFAKIKKKSLPLLRMANPGQVQVANFRLEIPLKSIHILLKLYG